MTDSLFAIVNPASAGGRTGGRWLEIRERLSEAGIDTEVHRSTGPREATEATRAALREGFATILAVGGDGTLNEVVNGCFNEEGEPVRPDTTIALMPSGSGGDFRRSIAIDDADAAIQAIRRGRRRRIDVGRIDYRQGAEERVHHFVNIADWGVGAAVVRRVNASSHKGGGARGTAIFLGISLGELLRFRGRRVRVTIDGRQLDREVTNLIVANGQYFGGGMRVAPYARLDDGQLDVIIMPQLGTVRTLWNVPRVYRGTHLSVEGIEMHRGGDIAIQVDAGEPLGFEAEGEPIGEGSARVRCLPGVLQLLW